jgi:L-threonylcarbamoyladenylate synthase
MPIVANVEATQNHLLSIHDANLIVDHLTKGRVAVIPTDTGYMLAADALQDAAVDKIFELKGRPANNPIHVVVASVSMALDLVCTDQAAERVMEYLLPGPLTVICPKKEAISDRLVADTGNLGIRIPDSPIAVMLAGMLGSPLTATSLNISGQSPHGPLEELIQSLYWKDSDLAYVIADPFLATHTEPSTVVSFATHPWSILREGPVTRKMIEQSVRLLSTEEFSDWG